MNKILVDTIIYNPCIAVLKIDKENKTVDVFVRNKNEVITTNLITSKANNKENYFRIGKRTFWIKSLFNFNKMNDKDINKQNLKWEIYDNYLDTKKGMVK